MYCTATQTSHIASLSNPNWNVGVWYKAISFKLYHLSHLISASSYRSDRKSALELGRSSSVIVYNAANYVSRAG